MRPLLSSSSRVLSLLRRDTSQKLEVCGLHGEGAHPGSENSRSDTPASMAPVVISSSAAPAPVVGSLANTKNSPAATSSVVTRRSTLVWTCANPVRQWCVRTPH